MINARTLSQFHQTGNFTSMSGERLSLAAAVEHACWLASTETLDGKIPEPTGPTWLLIRESGWGFSDLREIDNGHYSVLNIPSTDDNHVWKRRVDSRLRTKLEKVGFSIKFAKALSGAAIEIVSNVWEHSCTQRASILAYQLEQQRVEFVVADLGIGVLKSLTQNPRYKSLQTSPQALEMAAKGASSKRENGFGFGELIKAVADHGAVRLRSGAGILNIRGTIDQRLWKRQFGVELPGLQVAFTCTASPNADNVTL